MTHLSFTTSPKLINYRDCLENDGGKYAEFAKGMLDRGVRVIGRGIWYISAVHTIEDIDHAVKTAGEVLLSMRSKEALSVETSAA